MVQTKKPQFTMAITDPAQLLEWFEGGLDRPLIAFVGRSNVGKSSLINTLYGQGTARTSKTPGRTQAVNIFESSLLIEEDELPYFIVDLPGYGYAGVSKGVKDNWNRLMGTFFEGIDDSALLLAIQDARHPNQKADEAFVKFIKASTCHKYLLFNKVDKLKSQKEKSTFKNYLKNQMNNLKYFQQIYQVSAEKKTGIDALTNAIHSFTIGLYHLQD